MRSGNSAETWCPKGAHVCWPQRVPERTHRLSRRYSATTTIGEPREYATVIVLIHHLTAANGVDAKMTNDARTRRTPLLSPVFTTGVPLAYHSGRRTHHRTANMRNATQQKAGRSHYRNGIRGSAFKDARWMSNTHIVSGLAGPNERRRRRSTSDIVRQA